MHATTHHIHPGVGPLGYVLGEPLSKQSQSKTRAEVRQEFASHGWSISGWAKQHGYSPVLVGDILNDNERNPKRKCLRGESHNIAVALGIKHGVISRPTSLQRYTAAAA